jgi:hypothetical protein
MTTFPNFSKNSTLKPTEQSPALANLENTESHQEKTKKQMKREGQ